jgi:hypothetical protein
MAIASERDARVRPTLPNTPHETAHMCTHLNAARRLAGSQHHRDGATAFGVVDMDRKEAAFVIMGIEQRELLMAVDDVTRVIDIEDYRCRFAFVGCQPLIDKRVGQANCVLHGRRVLQPG